MRELLRTNQTSEGPRKHLLQKTAQLTKGGLEKRGQDKCLKWLLERLGEKGNGCLLSCYKIRKKYKLQGGRFQLNAQEELHVPTPEQAAF